MEFYIEKLILSLNLPDYLTFIILYTAEFLIILFFFLITTFVVACIEKTITKLSANNTGGAGICVSLKILADTIKLLFKENIVPEKADKAAFVIAPAVVFVPLLFLYSLIPFNTDFCVNKSECGLIIFIAMFLISSFGITLGGFASHNKFSTIGAMRNCLQVISYSTPLILTAMSIAVLSETLSLSKTVISQAKYDLFSWYIFPCFLGFIIFFIVSSALTNRSPFDFSTAKSELAGGYKAEYSGVGLALFNLSEYALLFVTSIFSATVFLGGFLSPLGIYVADWFASSNFYYVILTVEQMFWLFAKSILLIFFVLMIQNAFPRLKPENLAAFSWKYLIPLSVINLLIVCIVKSCFGGLYV